MMNFFEGLYTLCNYAKYVLVLVSLVWLAGIVTRRVFQKCYRKITHVMGIERGPQNMTIFWNCNKADKNRIQPIVEKLPEALCYIYEQQGYRISFLEHNQYIAGPDQRTSVNSVGLFCPYEKIIFIDAERPTEEIKDTLYHELGHFCDWLAGFEVTYASDVDADTLQLYFDNLYNCEIPEYYRSNVREFTAFCASALYCGSPKASSEMLEVGKKRFQFAFNAANITARALDKT